MAESGVAEGLFGINVSQGGDDISAAIDKLFQHKDLDLLQMTTEIDPSMIFELTVLRTIQRKFNSPTLKAFAKDLYLHNISRDRKGRLELVEALLARRGGMEMGEEGGGY